MGPGQSLEAGLKSFSKCFESGMEAPSQQRYSFGPFVLDPAEKALLRDGHPISLPFKAFETLLALVENHGHVLEKAELLRRIWPNTFVEEATLAQNIFTLRKVLNDSSQDQKYDQQYIETVTKRGYRFVAPVRLLNGEARTEAEERAQTGSLVPAGSRRKQTRVGRLQTVIIAASILALCLTAGWYVVRPHPGARATEPAGKIMLAVLPFQNLTGDLQQDFLSDGFTEEMITQLGRMHPERLGVIARTSAMQYKGGGKDAGQIAQELRVDYVLEGSVRREGNRVRISAQLIQTKDRTHLWAENYDRDMRDVLKLQSEVAQAIARQIEIKLPPAAAKRLASGRAIDPEAYQLYLQGRFFLNKRTAEALQRSVDLFQQATSIDPNYVKAYAGLADSYILLAALGIRAPADVIPKGRAAALRAIELDEGSAEAHASMGFILSRFDWNWLEAEREFRRAAELDPGYTTAHHWYALHLSGLGRSTEAIAEIESAEELDPASPLLATDAGLVLYSARQYSRAKKECEKALSLDPGFGLAHRTLGLIDEEMGMHQEALTEFREARGALREDPWMLAEIGRSYARAGNRKQALESMRELRRLSGKRYVSPLALALLEASLDPKNDEVFVWLEKAYESRINLSALVVDPGFDGIRQDSRFHDLLKRAGLPEIVGN
jgi:TolB-like protein/DNA-binding winged helix-turn-helix (wHTH) protein/Flp pilus assembly protein TadD